MTPTDPEAGLPRAPIDRVIEPLVRFLHVEAAGGFVLLAASALALLLANSPLGAGYLAFWKTDFSIGFGPMTHSLKHWISDGLMVVFFFVIGLEVKRELVVGELRDVRNAVLPIAAALGGMVVPAAVYLALQSGGPGERGWGIPMATDIAFVVGCMAVLGSRVPAGLRVMLLSLAIVDDIGAILVIAIGYTETIDWRMLLGAFAGLALSWLMMRLGIRSVLPYAAVGVGVWFGFHESGVHATIAGVILGLMTPTDRRIGEARSPLERLENGLHPWVSFAIVPLFALANAGVPFEISDLREPIAVAAGLGLLLGKPLGILLASAVAVKAGWAALPEGVSWSVVCAGGFLAGIGFTMALFVAGLALEGSALDSAKIGVLAGSLLSAVIGMGLLVVLLPKRE